MFKKNLRMNYFYAKFDSKVYSIEIGNRGFVYIMHYGMNPKIFWSQKTPEMDRCNIFLRIYHLLWVVGMAGEM